MVGGRRYAVPVELKSTTVGSVSTARDVGPEHIAKWRSRVWLVGFYDSDGVTLKRMRGATLNNPHIPKRFFATFADKMVEVAPELGDDGLRQRVERSVREITMGSAKLRAVAATAAGER